MSDNIIQSIIELIKILGERGGINFIYFVLIIMLFIYLIKSLLFLIKDFIIDIRAKK